MTVSSTTSKVTYSGNGSTTSFTVPFYFLGNTHLSVLLRSAAGVETTKVLGTDYTVSGAGSPSGGSVSMTIAPDTGETLAILRNVPLTQEVDYQTNDPFPAQTHEQALDKLTMEVQQVSEALTRAVKVQATDTSNTADTIVATLINDAAQTQSLYNSFVGTYYGAYATAPTVDPLGNPMSYGDLYFNTASQSMKVYTSTGWQDTAQASPTSYTSQLFNGTGSQTAFTLSAAPASLIATEVFISGVRQRPTTDYTLSGTTLTFVSAPASGTNNIFVRWTSAIAVGVPNDGSVTTAKVQDKAVTFAKMQDVSATKRILGRNTAGAGVTEEVTLSQLLDWIGTAAQGDILFRGASGWQRLAAGAAGQSLNTLGAGADPAWGSTVSSGTAVSTTSGTAIDFTGIPSWVKRITVMFGGVSTSGASNLILRVGAGSIQTSSYQSGASSSPNAGFYTTNTTGFILVPLSGQASTSLFYGTLTITSMGGNSWTEAGNIYDTSYYTVCNSSGGAVALSGTLDRIRITTVNGTDTFDAGSINILYE